MFSTALLEGTDPGIQWVLWAVLAVFFVMVILGWLVASKGWLKEEEESGHESHEEHAGHDESAQA